MSKREKHRIVLSDYKAKKEEEGAIEIELDDATIVRIPPPTLWSDSVQEFVKANDNVGLATELLGGTERYAQFVAGGGTAVLLLSIVKDELDLEVGE